MIISWAAVGQNTLSQATGEETFETALELFSKKKYGSSRNMFEQYRKSSKNELKKVESEYYIAICAIRLEHADGEFLLEDFASRHREHAYSSSAYIELGNFYFASKKYKKAAGVFSHVDASLLKDEVFCEVMFKRGYAHFIEKQFEQALPLFNRIKRTNCTYQYASAYYAGCIQYEQKEYIKAEKDLRLAANDESYARLVPPLLSHVLFRQKDYDQVIEYGEGIIKLQEDPDPIVNLLTAESYFIKKDFKKAQLYFEQYQKKEKPSNRTLYKIAFSQFMNGDKEPAINNFKHVALKEDTVSQYGAYYLGVLYLEQQNKVFAVSAFDQARKQDYNKELKKDALLNFSKINYELGRYDEAIASFKEFREKHAGTQQEIEEVNDYLGNAYLKTNNLTEAIKHLEKIPNKSLKMQETFQKVTFYKGVEYFNANEYSHAVQLFERSLSYTVNKKLEVQAHLWMSEAYSIFYQYDKAKNHYAAIFRLTKEGEPYHLKARYGMGYAYFNSKEYGKALVHFKAYTEKMANQPDKFSYQDAIIRLADCYYATKQYRLAMDLYDLAIKDIPQEKDYAWFQKGLVYFTLNESKMAKNAFNTILTNYDKSRFRDNALFQYAKVDFEDGQYESAINGFSKLIDSEKQSGLIPNALLNRGISKFNIQKYESAIADYESILKNYPTSSVAHSALLGIQETLTRIGSSEKFDTFLTWYKEANLESGDLESIEFESGKNLYFNEKYNRAIISLKNFIHEYPSSSFVTEAQYYIGECYSRLDQMDDALNMFYKVIGGGSNAKYNRSLQRIADIELANGNYTEAIKYNELLLEQPNTKKEQFNGWNGVMKAYYELSNYDSVDYYAHIILEKGNVNIDAHNTAHLYLGKSAYERGYYEKALDYFLTTLNNAKDENGAEAQYLLAQILHNQKKYKQSIQSLFDLNKNFPLYERWLGKSFLLIADNYTAMEEYFQAKATLNSVIEKSPFPNIREDAKSKLDLVLSMEKNTKKTATKKDSSINGIE